jgi:hypothetical protein
MNAFVFTAWILAVLRVYIGATTEPESLSWVDVYKDVAHVYVGFLLALAWGRQDRKLWLLFWMMCVLEVMVAILSRVKGL